MASPSTGLVGPIAKRVMLASSAEAGEITLASDQREKLMIGKIDTHRLVQGVMLSTSEALFRSLRCERVVNA